LVECAFRHDTVSRLYDVYYSWQYSRSPDDDPVGPSTPSSAASRRRRRRRRRRRQRRLYLGVNRHGEVRTFRVRSTQRRPRTHDDDDDDDDEGTLNFHLPRRVMFFQRFVNSRPSSSSVFPLGRVSVVPPGRTSPPPTDATLPPHGDRRRKRKRRRRLRCSRLLRQCGPRRYRPPNGQRPTFTTADATLVSRDRRGRERDSTMGPEESRGTDVLK